MLTAKCTINKKKPIKFTEPIIEGFLQDYADLPHNHRCNHLKNKPLMILSVCFKKHFLLTDTYPECKNCKTLDKYRKELIAFMESYNGN